MSDDPRFTTVSLDRDTIVKMDMIAAQLGELVCAKISRSAVARRAIRDLFLRICPTDMPKDVPVVQDGQAETT